MVEQEGAEEQEGAAEEQGGAEEQMESEQDELDESESHSSDESNTSDEEDQTAKQHDQTAEQHDQTAEQHGQRAEQAMRNYSEVDKLKFVQASIDSARSQLKLGEDCGLYYYYALALMHGTSVAYGSGGDKPLMSKYDMMVRDKRTGYIHP
eukprot:6171318-Pleurochrysis_carterae.AAC.1